MKAGLIALFVIGLVAIGVGAQTWAYFSDTETSSDNYIEAGTLDLLVNGGNDPGTLFTVGPVYPGWYTDPNYTITLKNNGDIGGYLYAEITVNDDENGIADPEDDVDSTPNGELSENINVVLKIDGNIVYTGTLKDLPDFIDDYEMYLTPGQTVTVEIYLEVPESVGNEIQSDKAWINITWHLEQNDPGLTPYP